MRGRATPPVVATIRHRHRERFRMTISVEYSNKMTKYLSQISRIIYFCGLPNIWIDDMSSYAKFLKYYFKLMSLCFYVFVAMEVGAFFTQSNLSEKQASDRVVFGFSHPILITYYESVTYYGAEIKDLLYTLAVNLKKIHNDENLERNMIKKCKIYSLAYLFSFSSAVISYGFDGIMQVIRSDGTFTIVMTAWPDVGDKSTAANITRIISYILWLFFMIRVCGVFVLITSLIICLSHQYKNVQSYFEQLNDIFEQNGSQEEKERRYEDGLKIGIKLHADTLWCTRQTQKVCSVVFSGQILNNVAVFCLLMLQMVNSERTLMNTFTIVSTSVALLTSTGFFMWSAGDITVEAALVPTAMFTSGWPRCRARAAARVRTLLVVAMSQGQKPVELKSFGIIGLSYQSYVSIVKSSYSAFSILY